MTSVLDPNKLSGREPLEHEKKFSKDDKERLADRISYMKTSGILKEYDYFYIFKILTNEKKRFTRKTNEVLLNFSWFSDETLYKVQLFLNACEENHNKKQENNNILADKNNLDLTDKNNLDLADKNTNGKNDLDLTDKNLDLTDKNLEYERVQKGGGLIKKTILIKKVTKSDPTTDLEERKKEEKKEEKEGPIVLGRVLEGYLEFSEQLKKLETLDEMDADSLEKAKAYKESKFKNPKSKKFEQIIKKLNAVPKIQSNMKVSTCEGEYQSDNDTVIHREEMSDDELEIPDVVMSDDEDNNEDDSDPVESTSAEKLKDDSENSSDDEGQDDSFILNQEFKNIKIVQKTTSDDLNDDEDLSGDEDLNDYDDLNDDEDFNDDEDIDSLQKILFANVATLQKKLK